MIVVSVGIVYSVIVCVITQDGSDSADNLYDGNVKVYGKFA